MTESTVGMIICIICFSIALGVISVSINYLITKVNKIQMDAKYCAEELKDFRRSVNYNFEVMDGVMKENRKILEEINKRI